MNNKTNKNKSALNFFYFFCFPAGGEEEKTGKVPLRNRPGSTRRIPDEKLSPILW